MRKKLRLGLDTLRVDTFETVAAAEGRGTVRALEYTCGPSCNRTCGASPPPCTEDICRDGVGVLAITFACCV